MSEKPSYEELEKRVLELEQADSQRDKALEALHENERYLDNIINTIADPIFVKNREHRWVLLNDALCQFMDHSREELLGKSDYDFFPKKEADVFWANDELVFTSGKRNINEEKITDTKGEVHTIVTQKTRYTDDKNEQYIVGIISDITDRKTAENALRESEEKASLFVENTPLPVAMFDTNMCYMMTSKRWLIDYKLDDKNLIGRSHYDVFPEIGDEWKDDHQRVLNGEIYKNVNDKFVREDGSVQWLRYELHPWYKIDKSVGGLVMFTEDITDRMQADKRRKELEAQVQQAQKMEAIGTLAGGIAHDFNNILSGILGYSELAQVNLKTPEKAAKHIEQVIKGVRRATGLTRQILTFSRQSEYQKQPIKMSLEIKEALELLRSSIPSTIEIKARIDSPKKVLADPIKIHQLIMNLCTNAYHAMRKTGGDLMVSLTDIEISKSSLFNGIKMVQGEYIKLEVSDTGHGMDKKILTKAFDPYFTTKEKGDGTGFGLALVQAIVEEHDGFYEVISAPAQGTSFFIYFPIVQEEINDNAPQIEQEFQLSGNETIMVVDDEAPIRESCKQFMEGYGYQVQTFSNGIEALGAFKANLAKFDLIITDMTMPGLTGEKLAVEVLKIKPDLPIVLCTGFNENISMEGSVELGIKKFIQKPVLNQDLLVLIREILKKNDDATRQ